MKKKRILKEKYIVAKRKSTELIDQIREDLFYEGIDIAFALEEEVAWYLIRIIDKIDNGMIPAFTLSEYLTQIAVYHSKFFRIFKRRDFVPTGNNYKKKDYLFFGFDNPYYTRLKKIIDEFPKDKTVLLATDISTQKRLKDKGIDFVSFGDYLAKPNKRFKINANDIKWQYKGVNLAVVLRKYIKYLEKKAEIIAYYIESFKKIYNELGIKKIITVDSVVPINRTAILVAKKMGVESWIVKTEIVSKESGRYLLPMLADKICVYGKHDKNFLIKNGIAKNRIFSVGMDVEVKKFEGQQIGKETIKGGKIVVFFSHFYDDLYSVERKEKTKIMEKLCEIADNKEEKFHVIIKLHPREGGNVYGNHPNITIVRDYPSAESLIESAKVVLVGTSNTGLKVIAMNKPLIVLDYVNLYIPLDYKKYKIPVLKCEDDIIKAINNYNIKKEKRKELLGYYCGGATDLNLPAEKIKNLIINGKTYKKR